MTEERVLKRMKEIRQARTCLKLFGEYLGPNGWGGEEVITYNLHRNINIRGNPDFYRTKDNNAFNNMLAQVSSNFYAGRAKNNKERIEALKIYTERQAHVAGHNRRRQMSARRWLHRLGYLEERIDDVEISARWGTSFYKYIYKTTKDFRFSSGINISAGARVLPQGEGKWRLEGFDIYLTPREALEAGVKGYPKENTDGN